MTHRNQSAVVRWMRSYGTTIALTVALVLMVRWKVVQPFFIPSSSMSPTLKRLDRILVSKVSYAFSNPQRWDVVIFMEPKNHGRSLVKRIVGLPNEAVQIIAGSIYINGRLQEKPDHLRHVFYTQMGKWGTSASIKVPDGCYFVLGDNSAYSNDSRSWERPFVSRAEILGEAVSIVWPPERIQCVR